MGEKLHVIPKYLGGTDDDSNVVPNVSKVWHAFQHLLTAESLGTYDPNRIINLQSYGLVKGRCNLEEKKELDKLITLHHHSR